jgi:hypothetical protein
MERETLKDLQTLYNTYNEKVKNLSKLPLSPDKKIEILSETLSNIITDNIRRFEVKTTEAELREIQATELARLEDVVNSLKDIQMIHTKKLFPEAF